MAKEPQHSPDEPESESTEERQRRSERLASFYKSPRQEPPPEATQDKKRQFPSLTDVDPVLRSEFNTASYLAIGFSLIALLLIGILFFRPPKPEAEIRALTKAQVETRATLERLSGQIAALSRRADISHQSNLARSLRVTLATLEELNRHGNPSIRAEAEELQAQVEALLEEVERAGKAGRRP